MANPEHARNLSLGVSSWISVGDVGLRGTAPSLGDSAVSRMSGNQPAASKGQEGTHTFAEYRELTPEASSDGTSEAGLLEADTLSDSEAEAVQNSTASANDRAKVPGMKPEVPPELEWSRVGVSAPTVSALPRVSLPIAVLGEKSLLGSSERPIWFPHMPFPLPGHGVALLFTESMFQTFSSGMSR